MLRNDQTPSWLGGRAGTADVSLQVDTARGEVSLHSPHPHLPMLSGPSALPGCIFPETEGLRTWELCLDISPCSPKGDPKSRSVLS